MFKLTYIIAILFSFTAICAFSQEENNLKGDIKTVRMYSYEAVENSGQIVKGKMLNESISQYNLSGDIEKYLEVGREDTLIFIYRRDKDGKLLSTIVYRGSVIHKQTEFMYNSRGDLVSLESINPIKDTVIGKEIFRYDETGALTESVITINLSDIQATKKYDDAENISEIYLSSGKVEYIYDSLGREIKEITYNNEGVLLSRSFTIYEGNLQTEMYEEDAEGIVEWRSTNRYSNFDAKGNWLRKVIYEDDEVFRLIIREIEYY